MANKVVYINVN